MSTIIVEVPSGVIRGLQRDYVDFCGMIVARLYHVVVYRILWARQGKAKFYPASILLFLTLTLTVIGVIVTSILD